MKSIPYILILILIVSCADQQNWNVVELKTFSSQESSSFPIADISVISLNNNKGGVIIYGRVENDTIDYTISKTINADTRERAENNFKNVQLSSEVNNDTLKCSMIYPFDSDYMQAFGYLDLHLPHLLPCIINNMSEGVFVFSLWNDLKVSNSKDHVDIRGHHGSCDIQTQKGVVSIETILPDSGYCRANTGQGNIILTIPRSTSATIYARTWNGEVSAEYLDISDLENIFGEFRGVIGEGSAEIHLETLSGHIKIIGM